MSKWREILLVRGKVMHKGVRLEKPKVFDDAAVRMRATTKRCPPGVEEVEVLWFLLWC